MALITFEVFTERNMEELFSQFVSKFWLFFFPTLNFKYRINPNFMVIEHY